MKYAVIILAGLVLASSAAPARSAKVWDPWTAIDFELDGADDAVAPSDDGDNGIQTLVMPIVSYHDVDHWIDPNESAPNDQCTVDEELPYSDIYLWPDYEFLGTWFGCLSIQGDAVVYEAPEVGGEYVIEVTATDDSEIMLPGESGSRYDVDDTDYWWDEDYPDDSG